MHKKGTKTSALFVLKKILKKTQRTQVKRKHQENIFPNGKQTCDEPQKPERTPKRQNTTTRDQRWQPSKLPTEQHFFRFLFLKKNRSIKFFKIKNCKSTIGRGNSRICTSLVLPCDEIGLNQLREAYKSGLFFIIKIIEKKTSESCDLITNKYMSRLFRYCKGLNF